MEPAVPALRAHNVCRLLDANNDGAISFDEFARVISASDGAPHPPRIQPPLSSGGATTCGVPPPTAHRPPPTAHRPPPNAHRPPPNAHRPPPIAQRAPRTAHRPPPNAVGKGLRPAVAPRRQHESLSRQPCGGQGLQTAGGHARWQAGPLRRDALGFVWAPGQGGHDRAAWLGSVSAGGDPLRTVGRRNVRTAADAQPLPPPPSLSRSLATFPARPHTPLPSLAVAPLRSRPPSPQNTHTQLCIFAETRVAGARQDAVRRDHERQSGAHPILRGEAAGHGCRDRVT